MPRIATEYKVTSFHGKYSPCNGEFVLTVYDTFENFKFVSGEPFGCSRNYYTDSDESAISLLLAEHGATLVKAEKCTE